MHCPDIMCSCLDASCSCLQATTGASCQRGGCGMHVPSQTNAHKQLHMRSGLDFMHTLHISQTCPNVSCCVCVPAAFAHRHEAQAMAINDACGRVSSFPTYMCLLPLPTGTRRRPWPSMMHAGVCPHFQHTCACCPRPQARGAGHGHQGPRERECGAAAAADRHHQQGRAGGAHGGAHRVAAVDAGADVS